MYEKRLLNKELLFFQYAPPVLTVTRKQETVWPKRPHRNATGPERSVYFHWWRFLRLNKDYIQTCENEGDGPLADLYKDFGDIRNQNFVRWWLDGGRELFCEPPNEGVRVEPSWKKPNDLDNRLLVSLPFTGDVERTLSEIRHLLEGSFDRLGIKKGPSQALYPVAARPNLSALHKYFKIHSLKLTQPDATNIEIYSQLNGLSPLEIPTDERNRISASISRDLTTANRLIHWVGKGIFPATSDRIAEKHQQMLIDRNLMKISERRVSDEVYEFLDARKQRKQEGRIEDIDNEFIRRNTPRTTD